MRITPETLLTIMKVQIPVSDWDMFDRAVKGLHEMKAVQEVHCK